MGTQVDECLAKKRSEEEERNRVLTMKYGKQQMMLIRKRMKIENWIDAEVAKLFNGNDNNGVDIDVDVLLDLDSVPAKRKFVFVSEFPSISL
ncbi:hypothetical protein ANCCAN_13697 [Ancylostoma caninum]|uniref:Uncharacterized protein n=1 Tax=Ancylostoma caninum TaxID=29170 RepID=A0A368GBJ6_ANCCA|nr:hypothetical protein ANCCAN_13697 [Ancylostoma caninum]